MSDNKEILKLIEQAEKEGHTELDLSYYKLTSLPLEITDLTNLSSLILSNNQLTSLPPELAKLTNLTHLYLYSNQLTTLPPEIAKLPNLTTLVLSKNESTSLPMEFGGLTKLANLYLAGNQFSDLPSEITQLTNLTTLVLSKNQLTSLPTEIAKLTKLTTLDLAGNQLTNLPPGIMKLNRLKSLNLGRNQLTSLPSEIGRLTNLTFLGLGWGGDEEILERFRFLKSFEGIGNQLKHLPAEISNLTNLMQLDLSGNQLSSLPPDITKLTNLTRLDLRDNQLPISPETLAKPADVKAIFAAIAGLKTGQRLNEAKMLVVGDGKVGKSSVVERLIYNTFNPKKGTTLGVDINDEMQVAQSEVRGEGEPVKLNIWDFGGQEIQHSTHQFFLTTRSLYLLVVDARKGDQLSNIEYWLKLIASFGGDSPIVIVINQIDQLKGQRELNLDRNALKKKYNIKDFVATACTTGEGFAELKASITREVTEMKHVRDIWPREWIAIKQRLREMKKDYIPVETYEEICAEEKLSDRDLRESLLGLLHDLGVVIRFPGDTQVLNPRWVTQGVYGLLTSARLVKDQGQFDLKDVGEILASLPTSDHYLPHTHRRLIDVMRHFELCFEFTDRADHYLIPRHLHDNELETPWEETGALKFQYHYETLPDAVISRFIVRMNQYITKQYYWKNGVFLQSGENRAKVKADLVDRKIFISILGKKQTRRGFLAIIRSAFDEINRNFKIEIKQMIPVTGDSGVLISYKDLLALEEMNEPEIVVPELRQKFSVRELLDGVEELSVRIKRRERDLIESRFLQDRFNEIQAKSQAPSPQPKNKPLGSLMSFVIGFVVVLGAIVGSAVVISKWVSVTAGVMTGIVIIGAVVAIGVIGAMQLRNDDRLAEDSFLKLMIESYKRLPLLRGSGESTNELKE